MKTQEAQKNKEAAHLATLLAKLEPKLEELMVAPTKEAREKLQRDIIALTEKAGYHQEVLQFKAMFNL